MNDAVANIENSIGISENVQTAYDEFQMFIHDEMDNKIPKKTFNNGIGKRKKSLYKPYWNLELTDQWNRVCEAEKKWLKCKGQSRYKRKLKSEFIDARKQFDRINRKYKRKYAKEEQRKLKQKLNSFNKDFWKSIGRTGIANERKAGVPWAVVDENGNIKTDKDCVLNKWKDDFQNLFSSDQTDSVQPDETTFNIIYGY